MKKVIPSLLLFFIISGICFAEPKLESYLINDLELKRLLLEYQKANLAAKKMTLITELPLSFPVALPDFSSMMAEQTLL